MASIAMPPPSLAHRRPKSASCSRKMQLPKAATFQQPSSPSAADDPVLSVPHLSKRTTTYTRSSFASWLYSGREAAADALADFEQTFSGARGTRPATRRRSARDREDSLLAKAQHRPSSPVDSGIGSSIGSPSEKNLSNSLEKALDLVSNKDSALGESVSASVVGSSELFVQDANSTKVVRHRRSSIESLKIIRYPLPSNKKDTQPLLGHFARRQLYKRLFAPLLQEARFEEFHPIVAGARKNKNLRCLRDIEQSLINQPVVSTIYPLLETRSNQTRKTLVVTPAKYRAFGELTVQLVVDTYQHLSELEQRRATDRAYDNGYFLDLVQQVQQLAAHIGSSNTSVEDGSAPTVDDEITLEGGLAESGNLAELVRWKNGEGISLRTGLPYVPMAGMKRSASGMDEANADLSMARRKKGVEYQVQHLPCSIEDCEKVFTRQCDLSKHEKTHSRPFKCDEPGCKYVTHGLPTLKELERHKNDKHNGKATMYKCHYCEFNTKRESNCKQHMEKKHGWNYQRSKGKDKAVELTPAATPHTQAAGYGSVLPSPVSHTMSWDNHSPSTNSIHGSPYQQPVHNLSPAGQLYPNTLFPHRSFGQSAQLQLDTGFGVDAFTAGAYPTPSTGVPHNFTTPRTPAYSNITASPANVVMHGVYNNQFVQPDIPTPESSQSRHLSNPPEVMMNGFDTSMGFESNMDMDYAIVDDGFGMPQGDFNLFDTTNPSAFTHNGAGDLTLFPTQPQMQMQMHSVDTHFSESQFEVFNDNSWFENNMSQEIDDLLMENPQ
ncbi:hypothetical protein LTR51_006388 [Lithohypha guttulata]|nr:hypothetical protein LTR51_006388 [Lithohypha guttulata]